MNPSRISVLSRNAIEAMHKYEYNDYAISFTDPHERLAKIDGIQGFHILRIQVYDIDVPLKDLNGGIFYPLTDAQAKSIAKFVKKNWDHTNMLFIHCEAGISRSSGCAGAIAKYYFGDDEYYFQTYHPNMCVYRKVLEALNNGD